jgi:hypothetical protein
MRSCWVQIFIQLPMCVAVSRHIFAISWRLQYKQSALYGPFILPSVSHQVPVEAPIVHKYWWRVRSLGAQLVLHARRFSLPLRVA